MSRLASVCAYPARRGTRSTRSVYFSALLGIGLALSSGCSVNSQSIGFVDPAHRGSRYDGFLAYAAFKNLGIEAAYERAFCRQLHAARHACTTMLAAASPTKPMSAARRQYATQHSGAQAALVIELADMQSVARRVLSNSGPRYRVTLIDNDSSAIVARFAVYSSVGRNRDTRALARSLAQTVVHELRAKQLLVAR